MIETVLRFTGQIDLITATAPELTFWDRYALAAYDRVYIDISTDGGQTWTLREQVFETDFHSNGDVAYLHPDSGELYWTYKIGKEATYLTRSSGGRTSWGEKVRLPFKLRYDTGSFIWLESDQEGLRRMVLATHDGKGVVTWTSDDDGTTWEPVLSQPGMGRTTLAIAPSAPNVIFQTAEWAAGVDHSLRAGNHFFRNCGCGVSGCRTISPWSALMMRWVVIV